ncbi:MAG: 50S ribosomal protein L20 [Phycisphaerae bacterium]|nr:50S ribosomal protein L20 [Phycisphaerae bacterium]
MPRVSVGAARARRKRRIRAATKGYRASRSKQTHTMMPAITRAGVYAYRDRRARKRDFRGLWITRLTAACRARGISYSRFMKALKLKCVGLNRKMLSELAIADEAAFDKIVALAQA